MRVLIILLLCTALLAYANGNIMGQRIRRGAAYAGALGYATKLTPSVALGTFGGHVVGAHGGGYQKQTVQEALGAYGGFLQGGHQGPSVIGNDNGIFNKGH